MTAATPSRRSRNVASASAVRAWRSTRTASVAIPRSTRKAANGPSVAPVSIWAERTAAMRSRDPTTAPAITSRVTRQVLRPRLHHEVGAVLERPADRRRGEGVVDGQQRPVPVRDLGERRQVGEDAGRVGDGLDVEDAGPGGGQRRPRPLDVGGVDVRDLDAEPPERGGRLRARRPVADLPDDQPVAGPQEGQEARVDRRHAGRQRDPRLGAVELGDRVAEGHDRRVVDPAVRVARLLAREHRRQLLRVARGERRRLVDRDRGGRLAHDGLARRRPDGARGRARPGSLVRHPRMLHRAAGTTRRPRSRGP